MRVLLLLAFVGMAAAECPDACSGHGFCGQYDKCTCYRNWMGNACEKRTCPYDLAFVDVPLGDLNMDGKRNQATTTYGAQTNDRLGMEIWPTDGAAHGHAATYDAAEDGHFYAECSNKGMCDRKSGVCSCFDGYSGTACRRVACPNDCSGHGTCERMEEFGQKYWTNQQTVLTGDATDGSAFKYELWDRYKAQVCACDPGYFGIDCSNRHCPYGDDPLTVFQEDEVQSVDINGGGSALSGTYRLSYVDEYGETWDTMPIKKQDFEFGADSDGTNAAYANTVKAALKGIPNSVFEDVTVVAEPLSLLIPGSGVPTSGTVWTATATQTAVPSDFALADIGADAPGDAWSLTNCATTAVTAYAVSGSAGGPIAITHADAGSALDALTNICQTATHGMRLKVTFTRNPGDLNPLYAVDSRGVADAAVTSHGDKLGGADGPFFFGHAGSGTTVTTNSNLGLIGVGIGDRVIVPSWSNQVFTLTSAVTKPATDQTAGQFSVAESYGTQKDIGNTMLGYVYTAGTKEQKECSHRGLCDHSAGVCECFAGYTNDDCGMQAALSA